MPRSIWKGHISFGLVNIPVSLHSASRSDRIDFNLLDQRDMSRVRYKRVNEVSGEEVPYEEIVRGYEHEDGEYVVITDEDLAAADPEATQTVEIEEFVDAGTIPLAYYDKPYYLTPGKQGDKSYALLREAMRNTGKTGIAQVVIRTRQYLCALTVQGDLLVLDLLRYPNELRDPADYDVPGDADEVGLKKKELEMAESLISGLEADWEPDKYEDTYRQKVMAMIEEKVSSGEVEAVRELEADEEEGEGAEVVDLMALLKKSVEKGGKKGGAKKKSSGKKSSGKKKSA